MTSLLWTDIYKETTHFYKQITWSYTALKYSVFCRVIYKFVYTTCSAGIKQVVT